MQIQLTYMFRPYPKQDHEELFEMRVFIQAYCHFSAEFDGKDEIQAYSCGLITRDME